MPLTTRPHCLPKCYLFLTCEQVIGDNGKFTRKLMLVTLTLLIFFFVTLCYILFFLCYTCSDPSDPDAVLIKRVIGVAGDHVK